MHYLEDFETIGKLRYKVFVEQLHWVPGDSSSGLELDDLDPIAHHIGVFDSNNGLIGYTRIIQGGAARGMLLEQEAFKSLFVPVIRLDATTAEVSRLCLKPNAFDPEILHCLLRAVYGLAIALHTKILYVTVSDQGIGYTSKNFLETQLGFYPISDSRQFSPGVNTYLFALEVKTASKSPLMKRILNA